jgi:hypothetical protein
MAYGGPALLLVAEDLEDGDHDGDEVERRGSDR